MSNIKIFIGADHNGFELKQTLAEYLRRGGYEVVDEGDTQQHPDDDYPEFASKVVLGMAGDPSTEICGILVCGDGQGMCMAANRFKGVRACLGSSQAEVRAARNDNDANVLCLSAESTSFEDAVGIVQTWLMTPFAGAPRFKRRIEALDALGSV